MGEGNREEEEEEKRGWCEYERKGKGSGCEVFYLLIGLFFIFLEEPGDKLYNLFRSS